MKVIFKLNDPKTKWREGMYEADKKIFKCSRKGRIFSEKHVSYYVPIESFIYLDHSRRLKPKCANRDNSRVRLKLKSIETFQPLDMTLHELDNLEDSFVESLKKAGRSRAVKQPRWYIQASLIWQGYTFAEVGGFFNQDHSTVLHACTMVIKVLEGKDKVFKKELQEVMFKTKTTLENERRKRIEKNRDETETS
jgi:hypothetical protein